MAWVRPTGYSDPSNRYSDETNAYDSSTATFAYSAIHSPGYWNSYLEFTKAATYAYQVRFICSATDHYGIVAGASIGLEVYYDGSWHSIYSGSFTYGSYVTKNIGSAESITGVRVRFYNGTGQEVVYRVYDIQLNTVAAPTVTTSACSDVLATSVKGNGNITSVNGENATQRGFCYIEAESGDPTTADDKVYDTGSFGTGSFSKTISGLSPGTTYRVRAYAVNSVGTGYGTTVSVTTDKVPTVTTTTPVTTKDHESATLEGEVTDADGQDITERGFEYKEGAEGEVSSVSEEDDDFGTGAFSLEITGLEPNTKYYFRAYAVNPSGTGYGDWESFTTDKTTPTVTVNSMTDILPTTATANGNITSTGGEDCSERGFQYGLTKVATWSVKDDVGGYGAGVFSKGLTDLSANTTYWIRAYAVNSIGTGYSEWLEFQTAAAGIIPTGTLINICSDYSGYTYKLMRSETDDGEAYTAYFVISTDLANKQGLSFYKRILDMDLYFNNEDSGTATISVKRDNETSWVSLGSVSLAGDDDIIIKHLAVDVRAKHFLFKISASNHFEFLGVLFQFIPIGMR
jgi:hypothetical protein